MPKSFYIKIVKATGSTMFPVDMATSKRMFIMIYAARLFFRVGLRLWRDRCPRQAAALAYQTFLSLVPLLFIALAVAGVLNLDNYVHTLIKVIEDNLLPEAAQTAAQYVRELAVSIKPDTLGFAGGLGFLAVAMALFMTLDQMVNDIFSCKNRRPFVITLLTSIIIIILVPGMLGLSLYFSGKLFFFSETATKYLFSTLLTIGSLFLIYWLLPYQKLSARYTLISSVITGFALELAKWGFAIYAGYLGRTFSYVYGTLAIIPLFMIWIYTLWLIFLFGAELSASLHEVSHYNRLSRNN